MENQVKKIIEKHGITKQQLAAKAGVSKTTIINTLKEKSNLSITFQHKIVNAINSLVGKSYLVHEVFIQNEEKLKIEDVFKKGGVPNKTFVEPKEYQKLFVSLRTPGRCLVVEGPSGVGKTTAVKKALRQLNKDDERIVLSARKKADKKLIMSIASGKVKGFFVIDDFHRLEENLQLQITDLIKRIADSDIDDEKIVLLGINKVDRSLYKMSPDLIGRIDIIRFESNSNEKIAELITKGEDALKINFKNKDSIVNESTGSFHLAQIICHEVCVNSKILEEQTERQNQIIDISIEDIRNIVFRDLHSKFGESVRQIATGPKHNPQGRAPYAHILKWLSEEEEWNISLNECMTKHKELETILTFIINTNQLGDFINKEEFSGLLYYNTVNKTISAEDAKFIYYLKRIDWTQFFLKGGFTNRSFEKKYDIALSFSGSERNIAESIFDKLTKLDISVFYDKNSQSALLSKPLEKSLETVYKDESLFVVALFSNSYYERIWTEFESKVYVDRDEVDSIIPVRIDNIKFGFTDKFKNIGSLDFDNDKDFNSQIDEIVNILQKKIEYEFFSKVS